MPEPYLRLIPGAMTKLKSAAESMDMMIGNGGDEERSYKEKDIDDASGVSFTSHGSSSIGSAVGFGIGDDSGGMVGAVNLLDMKDSVIIDTSTIYPYHSYLKSLPKWKWLHADTLPIKKSMLSDAAGDDYCDDMCNDDDHHHHHLHINNYIVIHLLI